MCAYSCIEIHSDEDRQDGGEHTVLLCPHEVWTLADSGAQTNGREGGSFFKSTKVPRRGPCGLQEVG